MTRRTNSPFIKLELSIAADERGGAVHRWNYGRKLLDAKAGRKQLPHGMTADLIAAAARAGITVSDREIRRRVQCAEAYDSEAKVGQALADFGTWSALAEAGFPPVESPDSDELEASGISTGAPDAFEQLALIPGIPAELKVAGRSVPIAEASVADVKAYRDRFRQMHENFGKTLSQINASIGVMDDGSDGDDATNALQAWRRGVRLDAEVDA